MSKEAQVVIPPQFDFNYFKCSDIWVSPSYFDSIEANKNEYFKSNPIAYLVYGLRNLLVLNQIHDGLVRFVSLTKLFKTSKDIITCLAFSKNPNVPVVFAGSLGSFLLYNIKENTTKLKTRKALQLTSHVTFCEWLNSNNLYFTISSSLYLWDINKDHWEIVYKVRSGCITSMALTTSVPVLIALGSETGDITVLESLRCIKQPLFKFNMTHEICSLSFSFLRHPKDKWLLAAISKNGHIRVWDLFSDQSVVVYQNLFKEMQPFNAKTYFTLSFIPTCRFLNPSNYSDTVNDEKVNEKDEDNNSPRIVIGFPQGDIKLLTISKSHSSDSFYEHDLVVLDAQNKYPHTSTILNFAISNPYVNHLYPLPISKRFLLQGDIHKDKDIPFIAVSLSADRKIIVWDMKKLKAKSKSITSEQTRALAFSPFNHKLLAIASKNLLLWKVDPSNSSHQNFFDIQEFSIPHVIPKETRTSALCWHPNEQDLLALGTANGYIYTINISEPNQSLTFTTNRSNDRVHVYNINWGPDPYSPNSNNLAIYCVSSGGWIDIFVPSNGNKYDFLDVSNCSNQDSKTEISWKSDFKYLAIGYKCGTVEVYQNKFNKDGLFVFKIAALDKFHLKLIQSLQWHPNHSSSSCTSHLDKNEDNASVEFWLAAGSKDQIIKIIDLKPLIDKIENQNDQELVTQDYESTIQKCINNAFVLSGHSKEITTLSWCPLKIGILASCSYDYTVQCWDVRSLTLLYNFRGHSQRIFAIAWSLLDPDLIISAGDDYTIQMWRPSQQKFNKPPQTVNLLTFPKLVTNFKILAEENTDEIIEDNRLIKTESKENLIQEIDIKEIEDEIKNDNRVNQTYKPTIADVHSKKTKSKSDHSSNQSNSSITKFHLKKKSLIPLTNVTENCPSKQQHLYDIKFMMSQNGLISNLEQSQHDENRLLIFGNKESISKLISAEVESHLSNDNISLAYQTELILEGDVKKVINKAIKNNHLNDWLVAMSITVSKNFWIETVKAYCNQLQKSRDHLLAATYLISIFEINQALELLCDKGLFKEALIFAKSRFPLQSPIITNIMTKWANDKESNGNLEMAAKILISMNEYSRAGQLLAKRENDPDSQSLSAVLTGRNGNKDDDLKGSSCVPSPIGQKLESGENKEAGLCEGVEVLKLD